MAKSQKKSRKDPFAKLKAEAAALDRRADGFDAKHDQLIETDEFLALAYLRAARTLRYDANGLINKAADLILGGRA